MSSLSNAPKEQAAAPRRKAKWVTPKITRMGAGDAGNATGGGDDGYGFGFGAS